MQQRIRMVWLGLLVSGLFLLWFSEFSDWGHRLEFWVSGQFYQAGVGFPLKDSASFEFWWHKFPKYVIYAMPVWALVNIVYGVFQRKRFDAAHTIEWQRWLAVFFVGLLIPLLLSTLKKLTNQACPWDLSDFGGALPYVRLLDPRPWAARSQACWPAGHVAVGLSLLVVSFTGGLSTHLVAKDIAVAHTALSMALGAGVRSLCVGVVDGFGIFAGDARGAFYFASILVLVDRCGVFDALCAYGAHKNPLVDAQSCKSITTG